MMSREKHSSSVRDESEIESKIVIVGSNKGYKTLIVAMITFLVGGVYYFYFSPYYIKKGSEIVNNEKIKQDIQQLKGKLEQVPHDDGMISERVITDVLPPLPPIPVPQVIPEVKQIKKEEVKKEEQFEEAHLSNMPVLPKQNFPSGGVTSNLPTSFPTIGGGYPRDRRGAQMLAILGSSVDGKTTDVVLSSDILPRSGGGRATRIGKLGLMIIQGKVIDAILETAISSDLQGKLRAIVSRDVYAESGNTILIPRGSRLIGGYSLDSSIAKARVNINWNRIILPHGIDIAVALSGIDELGRAGIAGIIDNKIVGTLFSSVALAAVSIGSAVVGDKASNVVVDMLAIMDLAKSVIGTELNIFPFKEVIVSRLKDGTVKTAIEGLKKEEWKLGPRAISRIKGVSSEKDLFEILKEEVAKLLSTALAGKKITEGDIPITLEDIRALLKIIQKKSKSVYENAIEKSINDFSKDMRDIVNRSVDKKPTVYVDQGTALKVFVNQDILFPSQSIIK